MGLFFFFFLRAFIWRSWLCKIECDHDSPLTLYFFDFLSLISPFLFPVFLVFCLNTTSNNQPNQHSSGGPPSSERPPLHALTLHPQGHLRRRLFGAKSDPAPVLRGGDLRQGLEKTSAANFGRALHVHSGNRYVLRKVCLPLVHCLNGVVQPFTGNINFYLNEVILPPDNCR
jgi:hypothetical protein